MANFYSILSTLIIGGCFVYIFIFTYDLLYGEKQERQMKKIHKYFRNENIKNITMTEREPKKFTRYTIETTNGIQKIKMKPGYKVVKIVPAKNSDAKPVKRKQR